MEPIGCWKKKSLLARDGIKVSVQDLLNDAVISTLRQHSELNGRLEGNEVLLSDLSMAVALPDNLLVAPAMFNAEKYTLVESKDARIELMERARAGKLSTKEMTGGSITVSNLGVSRVNFFKPILNAPQIAIVGFGAIRDALYLQ